VYIDFCKATEKAAQELPASPLKDLIEKENQELKDEKRVRLNITRIQREALAAELISREIDFSPKQIETLIAQGYRDACDKLKQTGQKAPAINSTAF
jgi:hypothetical protein